MVCERREASACLITLSAKQGSHWYHFFNVFGMTRPGIDPTPILTYHTRSGRSTNWAIAAVLLDERRGFPYHGLNMVHKKYCLVTTGFLAKWIEPFTENGVHFDSSRIFACYILCRQIQQILFLCICGLFSQNCHFNQTSIIPNILYLNVDIENISIFALIQFAKKHFALIIHHSRLLFIINVLNNQRHAKIYN